MRLVPVQVGGFVQLLFIELVQRLQAQQGGGLRQVGVEQFVHFVAGFAPGQGGRQAPYPQHQGQHGRQQTRLQ